MKFVKSLSASESPFLLGDITQNNQRFREISECFKCQMILQDIVCQFENGTWFTKHHIQYGSLSSQPCPCRWATTVWHSDIYRHRVNLVEAPCMFGTGVCSVKLIWFLEICKTYKCHQKTLHGTSWDVNLSNHYDIGNPTGRSDRFLYGLIS